MPTLTDVSVRGTKGQCQPASVAGESKPVALDPYVTLLYQKWQGVRTALRRALNPEGFVSGPCCVINCKCRAAARRTEVEAHTIVNIRLQLLYTRVNVDRHAIATPKPVQ